MPRFNLDNYVDVQERINRFWLEYPDGRIDTQLMSLPDEFERVLFKATVYKHATDANPSVTGWAAESAGSGGANQTSWHENAETSAIGRALANMGYAKNRDERPSRQEMDKANRGPAAPKVVHRLEPPPPADIETGEILEDAPKPRPKNPKHAALMALMGNRGLTDDDRHLLGWASTNILRWSCSRWTCRTFRRQ